MTTAPPPDPEISELLEWFSETDGFAQGTKAPHKWVLRAEQALRRLQAENERLQAAERTLQRLGYQDHGGQEWAPPIGQAPDFDLIDSLRARIAELDGLNTQLCEQADVAANAYRALEVKLVAEALATAEHKLRADQLAQQHRMQAQMHAQATQQLAELEARKPLPLSDDDRLRLRSDVARAIWDVMREHEDRCDHALEDVEPKHQVWDCADAVIRAMKDKP